LRYVRERLAERPRKIGGAIGGDGVYRIFKNGPDA